MHKLHSFIKSLVLLSLLGDVLHAITQQGLVLLGGLLESLGFIANLRETTTPILS